MKKKLFRRGICALLAAALLLSLLAGCGKKGGESPAVSAVSSAQTEETGWAEESGTLTPENPRVGSDRLALDLGSYPLDEDAACEIRQITAPATLDGVDIRAYNFHIDTDEKLDSVLRLTLPYDAASLAGSRAEGNVGAAYYNEDSGEWEPVPFTVDETAQTVTIYTDHLSVYGCFEVKNENTRKAYAAFAIPALAMTGLKNIDANEIITNTAQNGGNPSGDAVMAGMTLMDYVLALGSAGADTTAHIATALGSGAEGDAAILNGINDHLGNLGLLLSVAEVSYGMYNIYNYKGNNSAEEIFPCYANALKMGVGYTAGKMGARLYSLAYIGVLVVEYSVNKFAETAWSGRQDIYETAYSLYYESSGVKRSARQWARLFLDAKSKATSPKDYQQKVDALVTDYAGQFWKDDTEVAYYQSQAQKQGFTGGGGLNTLMEQNISQKYHDELFRTVVQDAFQLIAEREWDEAERALLKELNAVRDELNKTCTLEISDSTVGDEKPVSGLAGAQVYVDVPDNITDADSWSTTLDSAGQGRISFTVLAYLMAGGPTKLNVYQAGKSDTPDQTASFQAVCPVTQVVLTSGDTQKDSTPAGGSRQTDRAGESSRQPAGEFAWVLADTVVDDGSKATASANAGSPSYHIDCSCGGTSVTSTLTYIGETDKNTVINGSAKVHGNSVTINAGWSAPPSVLHGGDVVTLSLTVSGSATAGWPFANGFVYAQLFSVADDGKTLSQPLASFQNKDGDDYIETSVNEGYQSHEETTMATVPGGSTEGKRIAIQVSGGMNNGRATATYIYEWKQS